MSELVKVKHLHKEYGGNVVLKDINLSVKKGEVVVIIGPSGCGKSTFLRCLNGLEEIQGGVVMVDGLPVEPDKKEIVNIRQKIGMVFQSYDLFPHKTVLENTILAPIKVQKRNKDDAIREALELLDKVDSFEIAGVAELIGSPFTVFTPKIEIEHVSNAINAQTVNMKLVEKEKSVTN